MQGTALTRRPDEPRPPLLSTCADDRCRDCGSRGYLDDLRPCGRRHHWLRRRGYADLFGDRRAA